MKNDAAYSGERTRLASWRWRLANANLDFKRLRFPKKVRFGGSPKPARESRALSRVAAAGLLVATLSAGTFWLCLPKPPLMNDVSFSLRVFDRDGHQLRMTLSRDQNIPFPRRSIASRRSLCRRRCLHEDRFFAEHPGVNPVAVMRAAWSFLPRRPARRWRLHDHDAVGAIECAYADPDGARKTGPDAARP